MFQRTAMHRMGGRWRYTPSSSSCAAVGVAARPHPGCHRIRSLRCTTGAGNRGSLSSGSSDAATTHRIVWVETSNQAALTAAIESGFSTALFSKDTLPLANKWQQLASFEAISIQEDGTIQDATGSKIGQRLVVASKADLQSAEAAARQPGYLVMDATDWKVIPAENLVAAFQASQGKLLGVATSAADARVMLEALEAGTAGVVLRTEDPVQVKQLSAYLAQREAEGAPAYQYDVAKITGVTPVGMCDRVCVDLCSLLRPGEGMLVGSFARALFLVHSECMESQYINSRPFRVNAGAVHAYIQAPNNKTAYLSELKSGSEVLVVDAAGRARTAVVGRCKIETRPMMLVEAETADGVRHSTLLQNAETVRLVGPRVDDVDVMTSLNGTAGSSIGQTSSLEAVQELRHQQSPKWQAVAVTELQPSQHVYLLRQDEARHTGISIQEKIHEK